MSVEPERNDLEDPEQLDDAEHLEELEELDGVPLDEPRPASEPSYARFACTGNADTAAAVEAARRAVADGSCIVLPTDTVYGIGADAFDADAVQGLLDAKNRGRDMPPPVLIGDSSLIRALATDVPDQARKLVDAHWPGPLTVVCRIQPSLRMDLGDTDGTIALRVPDHALAREILRTTGPLAVSSANISGRPAARTCDEAVEQLGDRVAVYLDGGPVGAAGENGRQALPSTIVDFSRSDEGQVLRRGGLDVATLRRTLPGLRDLEEPAAPSAPDAPGVEDQPPVPGQAVPPQPDEPRVEPEPTG